MWFRTALMLILLLVAWRFVRSLAARLTAASTPARTEGGPRHPAGPKSGATAESGPGPSAWPPGEIIDVPYREATPNESSTR